MSSPRPKTDVLQGTLSLLVLKTLASNKRLHGYAITSHIQRVSEDLLRVEEGSLYPALHRLITNPQLLGLVRYAAGYPGAPIIAIQCIHSGADEAGHGRDPQTDCHSVATLYKQGLHWRGHAS